MSVGDICNHDAVIIGKSDSIYTAAVLMRDQHVNYVVVVESQQGNNIPIGAVTEREIVVDMVAERLDLDTVSVGEVMKPQLVMANEEDDVMKTLKRMRHTSLRCIPVINADKTLVGILSVDDILDRLSELLSDIGHILTRQQTFAHEKVFDKWEYR